MSLVTYALASSCVISVIVGGLVFFTNPERLPNRQFLVLSIHLSAWAASVQMVVLSLSPDAATLWIRIASIVTAFFPASFTLMRLSITRRTQTFLSLYRSTGIYLAVGAGVAILCASPFFLRGVRLALPEAGGSIIPEALYGPGFPVYIVYFITACTVAAVGFRNEFVRSRGVERSELQYVLLGFGASFAVGAVASLLVPLLSGSNRSSQFGPMGIVLLDLIVAYGIARHRILDVTTVLRRLISYALFVVAVVLFFLMLQQVGLWILTAYGIEAPLALSTVSAVLVVLAMVPLQGRIERIASYVIRSPLTYGAPAALQRTSCLLEGIATYNDLLPRFADLLQEFTDAESVSIWIWEDNAFVRHRHLAGDREASDRIVRQDPVVVALTMEGQPLVDHVIERRLSTPAFAAALKRMREMSLPVVVGLFTKRELRGLIGFGDKRSGGIYDQTEQDTLRLMCDQFAVALDNALLFTALQDEKIHREILLENLSSGVIACDAERRITLLNREASRILKAPAAALAGRGIDALPPGLAEPMEQTLTAGRGVHDAELVLSDGEVTHLRLSSSVITGLEGRRLGALVVLNDVTMLRRMEDRMRRADRLASVGTLAAGMAHEIKNPLVSIKTFVQVLPRAFDDPEVRSTFCPLIESEVSRIDTVVNHLLNFARPAKASLEPTHLHAVLVHTLRLVEPRLRSKGITLETVFDAPADLIEGDASLLEQVFINLYFNAVDAMSSGGRLRVETSVAQVETGDRDLWGAPVRVRRLRVSVRDTGHGIRAADLAHVFDPFFTTKSEGSGLGLAIAYGIIQEHRGSFDVESRVGEGTSFHVAFPLATEGGGL